jgi:hypothetical protein
MESLSVESRVPEEKAGIKSPPIPGIRIVVIGPWVWRSGDNAMPRIGVCVLVATVI